MKIKLNHKLDKTAVLTLIPFCIFFAIEGTFSIQSILPAIFLLIILNCLSYKNIKLKFKDALIIASFIFCMTSSMVYNMLFRQDLISVQSIIRIIYFIAILYVYFSLTNCTYSEKQIKTIIITNIFVGIIVSIYLIFINKIWFYNFLGVKIDKNFVAGILVIQGELSLVYYFIKSKSKYRIGYIISYLIIFFGIYYSASRAAILMYIFGTMIIIFFKIIEEAKNRKEIIKKFVAVFIIPIILVGAFLILQGYVKNSSSSVQWYWDRYFVNGFGDESVTGRIVWWKNALILWSERFFTGYGIGNANVSGNSSAVAHNTYLDFLLDQGFIGMLAYLSIVWRSIKCIIHNKMKIYYGVIISLAFLTLILSTTKSTLLWYSLILLYCIGASSKTLGDSTVDMRINKL